MTHRRLEFPLWLRSFRRVTNDPGEMGTCQLSLAHYDTFFSVSVNRNKVTFTIMAISSNQHFKVDHVWSPEGEFGNLNLNLWESSMGVWRKSESPKGWGSLERTELEGSRCFVIICLKQSMSHSAVDEFSLGSTVYVCNLYSTVSRF